MNEVVVLQAAEAESQEIYEWLEDRAGEGYGDRFLERLQVAFGQLQAFPGLGPIFRGSTRRLVLGRTPYGIFYSVTGRRILIGHVLDLRQDPRAILHRLGE